MGTEESFWQLHVSLPRDLREPVRRAAQLEGRTLAGWLRAAITEKLARSAP